MKILEFLRRYRDVARRIGLLNVLLSFPIYGLLNILPERLAEMLVTWFMDHRGVLFTADVANDSYKLERAVPAKHTRRSVG